MGGLDLPNISASTNSTIKIKKRILAISVAVVAIPLKPKKAAIKAITRKSMAQRNMAIAPNVSTGVGRRVQYPAPIGLIDNVVCCLLQVFDFLALCYLGESNKTKSLLVELSADQREGLNNLLTVFIHGMQHHHTAIGSVFCHIVGN